MHYSELIANRTTCFLAYLVKFTYFNGSDRTSTVHRGSTAFKYTISLSRTLFAVFIVIGLMSVESSIQRPRTNFDPLVLLSCSVPEATSHSCYVSLRLPFPLAESTHFCRVKGRQCLDAFPITWKFRALAALEGSDATACTYPVSDSRNNLLTWTDHVTVGDTECSCFRTDSKFLLPTEVWPASHYPPAT